MSTFYNIFLVHTFVYANTVICKRSVMLWNKINPYFLPLEKTVVKPCNTAPQVQQQFSPASLNSQPNLRASSRAVRSRAVWCINFLGIQPTFTHVPPRPGHVSQALLWLRTQQCIKFPSKYTTSSISYPKMCPKVWGQHNPEPWPSSPRQLLPIQCETLKRINTIWNITCKILTCVYLYGVIMTMQYEQSPLNRPDLQNHLLSQWGHSRTLGSPLPAAAVGGHLYTPVTMIPRDNYHRHKKVMR